MQGYEKYTAVIAARSHGKDQQEEDFTDLLGITFIILMLVLMLCVMCPFWLVYHLLRRFSQN